MDAQPEEGPCGAQCVGVRGHVWKVMKNGSRWVAGAGRQTELGPAQALSEPLLAEAHDEQF